MRYHSPLGIKLVVSPLALPFSCRSIPLMSYVHDPNFISHSWSSNGNHVMSILHVLRKRPGGTQRQSPLDDTTTFVGNVLSMSSSALFGMQNCVTFDDSMRKQLFLNPLMCTLKPQSNGPPCSNTVIGTLAVVGGQWGVTFGTERRGLGGVRPSPVPSSLYKMYQRPIR